MNIHAKASPTGTMSPAEWQARVDLAAVYRLVAQHGWDDVIYNHCSMRVPGEDRKFLMKRHELLWTEVTASNLVKVDMDADLDERAGVNRPGFTLHSAILRGRTDVKCAVHVHTRTGMAIAGLKSGLRMISQESVRFFGRVGYHPYEGITEDFGERERLIAHLGSNRAMIMHNHGVLTVGKSAREAFILMKQPAASSSRSRPKSARRRCSNTKNTTAAAAPPTGRLICACSTASIRATGPDFGKTVLQDGAWAKRASGSAGRARHCGFESVRTLASLAAEAGQDPRSLCAWRQ